MITLAPRADVVHGGRYMFVLATIFATITENALTTTAEPYFDGREMSMVHNMFRREFALMPGLVRAVAAGDHERAQIIAHHIDTVSITLHHHHHGEDESVWPLLLERVSAEAAPIAHRMGSQHEGIEIAATATGEALAAWRNSASAEDRDALAHALERMIPLLREHMSMEEEHAVPLMEKYMTAAEWDRVVQAGAADVDPATLPLAFGMVMYEGDPEVVDIAIANMPAEVRPIMRQLAGEAFATHSELIHGTRTPPRSTEL